MADRKLMIEVSEVLLLESSAPDDQERKRRKTTEMGNTVNTIPYARIIAKNIITRISA